MKVRRVSVWERDGYVKVDFLLLFEKSISISPIQLKMLEGSYDSDFHFLNESAKKDALHLEAQIESIDQIPQLESELKEIIARCQIAESERIKQDKLLYENVKQTLDKILSPYVEQEDENDDC